MTNEIMTCDKEWSHEELYGVAYDECMKACRNVGFLLDTPNLDKPNILMETIMDELDEGWNLVDYYNEMYQNRDPEDDSDSIFEMWDNWMQQRIKSTLEAHKYKHYAK